MKKGTARPSVRTGRGTTQCASAGKAAKKAEEAPAISDAAWMDRLQAVQHDLAQPKPPRGPRVGQLQPFVRKQIKKALPELCEAFLDQAKEGNLSTMKLLWQMAELDRQRETSGNGDNDRKFVRQAMAKYRKR